MSLYRNSEGYADPTAGRALSNIVREERREQKAAGRPTHPLVYICSPYAGAIENNVAAARAYCSFAVERGYVPLAPHLLYPQFMNDGDPEERSLALLFGKILLGKCDEVWVFGNRLSAGMKTEHEYALRKGCLIRYFTADCMELSKEGALLLYGSV